MSQAPLAAYLAMLAVLSAPALEAAEGTTRIAPADLQQRIERDDASLVVMDVRSAEEFAAGHVPGAINIPHNQLPARIAELLSVMEKSAADTDVVVYCEVGARAEKAAASLKDNGFTRLLHLQGDMKDWRESRRPLEK